MIGYVKGSVLSYSDGTVLLRLNRCRCMAREAELAAAEAFTDREGSPTRTDLLKAMNRLSSAVYLLMIREKARMQTEKESGS